MLFSRRLARLTLLTAMICAISASPALAYICPGAGIAAAGSMMVLVGTFLLAFGIILIWPLKVVVRAVARRSSAKPRIKRVVVVGLDGFDPGLAQRFKEEGLMPNFAKLEADGCFSELATACP